MKKILVIGSGGSGKSTLARQLGELLGIEVKHLDRLYWQAGWTEPSKEEWLHKVKALTSEDSWVMDGNFGGTLEVRMQRCDTIVFLDLPRPLCLWRIRSEEHTSELQSRLHLVCRLLLEKKKKKKKKKIIKNIIKRDKS